MMNNFEKKLLLEPSSSSDSEEIEEDEEEEVNVINNDHACNKFIKKKMLSKQLSMRETSREAKWENRRRQIINRRRTMMRCDGENNEVFDKEEEEKRMRGRVRSLTDEDLDELRGSIELGFGFNEEDGGHNLCDTLPALDLYFAVNRQLSDPMIRSSLSPASTPKSGSTLSGCGCGTSSPMSPQQDLQQHNAVDWKICNPGDNPQHVKTRLRQWAQAVACSVRQCC